MFYTQYNSYILWSLIRFFFYLQVCIDKFKQGNKPFPCCHDNHSTTLLDKGFQAQVMKLKVRCEYSKDGCKWEGELGDLQSHLNAACGYVIETCPNICGGLFPRHILHTHKNECRQTSDKNFQSTTSVNNESDNNQVEEIHSLKHILQQQQEQHDADKKQLMEQMQKQEEKLVNILQEQNEKQQSERQKYKEEMSSLLQQASDHHKQEVSDLTRQIHLLSTQEEPKSHKTEFGEIEYDVDISV